MIWQKTMQTIENKIVSRIYGRGRGWAFSANDFAADFGRSTVDWVLSDEATCERVLRDTVTATGWVYDAIKRVCAERG